MKNKNAKEKSYREYMERVGREHIPVYEPLLTGNEKKYLSDVVDRNWISEGWYTRKFEEELEKVSERKHALMFSCATSALITGMKCFDIGPGDDVIVPSFAHSADPNSIALVGANPVFSDVNMDSMCLDLENIKKSITPNTKAILYVNAFGNTGEIDVIEEFCISNNIILINDCAPAIDCKYKGRQVASYGDFSVLSFFADKTITTGEGGALVTNSNDLIQRANIYKHDGRKERGVDLIEEIGYNFRITEMQCAIGLAQIERIGQTSKNKKTVYQLYKAQLRHIDGLKLLSYREDSDVVPHRVIVFVDKAEELVEHLVSNNIGSRKLFMPMHSQPVYNFSGKFDNTERLFYTGVCLPSSPSLGESDIKHVSKVIKEYYE